MASRFISLFPSDCLRSQALSSFMHRKACPLFVVILLMLSAAFPLRVQSSDADAGDYPLNLTNAYPDAVLLNADKYFSDQKSKSSELGFTPFLYYWGDFFANPVGGLSHASDWTQLVVFGGEVHLDAMGWKDGALIVSFMDGVGSNLGPTVGTLFTPAQAQSFQTIASNALYLRQRFMNGKVEIRIGRFSSASVFASLPAMGSLPVSGAVNGTPTSLFANLNGWHSSGKPSWAAYAKVEPVEQTYIKAGILEVNPQANMISYHGFDMSMGTHDGTLMLTELGWTPSFQNSAKATPTSANNAGVKDVQPQETLRGSDISTNFVLPGIYMMGAYLQNYPQAQFNGETASELYGFYAQAQQMIWRNPANPTQNISLWGGLTYSPQIQSAMMPLMGYAGIYMQGLIQPRPRDITLLNLYTGSLNSDYAQANAIPGKGLPTQETVAELSYIIKLTDHFQLQPDLQWLIQPGGYRSIPNALIIGFQVAALF